jgi:hypothetical protein
MRWQADTAEERYNRKHREMTTWQKCFAWRPVRLTDDKNEIRWLVFVYRRGIYYGSNWVQDGYYEWQYADSILGVLKIEE